MKSAGLSPDLAKAGGNLPVVPQSAALCYRIDAGAPKVLLITTRGAGRWIIPKGRMIDGLSGAQTAAQEAWEEAGVTGHCDRCSVGQFSFVKYRNRLGHVMCRVKVYPLLVGGLSDRFPEAAQRRRKWFSLEKAAQAVSNRDLSALLRAAMLNPV